MKYIQILKQDKITSQTKKIIERHLNSLKKKLKNFAVDIPELTLVVKKHKKNHFLSGLISLTLPKKKLIAKVSGHTLNEVIHQGFDRINKEY